MLGLWQHCQEGGDQGSEFLASHSTPVETALKFAVSDELFSKGTNPLPLPRPKHPYWDTGLRNDPTPPPKYYGWHSLLTFLQRSRATPSTRHTPLSAVSTRGPNLLGHPHLPAAFCPSESHSISFACLWFQIPPLHSLEFLVCHQQTPLSLTLVWIFASPSSFNWNLAVPLKWNRSFLSPLVCLRTCR